MLAIYNSSQEYGGVDVLVERLGHYLSNIGHSYSIVSGRKTSIRSRTKDLNVITVEEANRNRDKITQVLFPSVKSLSEVIELDLDEQSQVFAWVLHPNDVFTGFFPFSGTGLKHFRYRSVPMLRSLFPSYRQAYDSFFATMLRQGGLATMDGVTDRTLRYFLDEIPKPARMIPLPADATPMQVAARTGPLAIGYLGRMDFMKWSALKGLLDHSLAPLAASRSVLLHMISEGPFINDVADRCRRYNITLCAHGYLPNDAARRLIRNETDVAVAMGTSALDLAGAGHPCVIIDPALSLRTRPQSLFRFVHETNDYSVGEFRDFPAYVPGRRPFAQCCDPKLLREAGEAGPGYVAQNHHSATIFATLLRAIEASKVRYGPFMADTKRLRERFWASKKSPISAAVRRAAPAKVPTTRSAAGKRERHEHEP